MIELARPIENASCPLPQRRGLSRVQAAGYIGVGASKFNAMVLDGRMPAPKKVDGRRIWDKNALDAAFDRLDENAHADSNPWDADDDNTIEIRGRRH
ncbi:MAG: hypothetical protein ABJ327_25600 [Litoreibacter sp.]